MVHVFRAYSLSSGANSVKNTASKPSSGGGYCMNQTLSQLECWELFLQSNLTALGKKYHPVW